MLKALYTSATGMKAQEMLIDNTANNLANVNTHGFRRSRVDFADLVYNTIRQPGSAVSNTQVSPTGLQIGNGVRVVGTTKQFMQGTLERSEGKLDVAIEGEGFFEVQLPGGEPRYTRHGSFKVDGEGQIVNADGYLLNPPITVPAGVTNLSIGVDGTVSGSQDGDTANRVDLGQIQLSNFLNPAGLSSEGSNLLAQTAASGDAVVGNASDPGFGVLRHGFLEGSNVELVTEMISLISAQRAYEVNSRAIRAGDEMLSTATDVLR
ncbi:MAG: flagellar basal-body rod protein FlgG [Fuerstiella sp.]|nr:flagellar basal-body rod protein FlgG [Fuerstiella sp.]MCP4510942.1 flagellar basal-body rod protein FlgG [Fuerstiella sp.]MDG2128604.1 flagellar basal-body rod protein FlgG [Fuerstiella sp.]